MMRAIRIRGGMAEYLLDSNVAIQHLRGHRPTTELLMRLAAEGLLAVSAITRNLGMPPKTMHVLEGESSEIKAEVLRVMEPFVQEAIHPFCRPAV